MVAQPWEPLAQVALAVAVGLAALVALIGLLIGLVAWATRPLRARLTRPPLPRHARRH